MTTPHDKLFKATFSRVEHARAELAAILPGALSAQIQWDTLELVSGEFVDPMLAHLESDLLFKARVGETELGFYVVFEHQSTVDRMMPLRLLRYMTKVWERFELDHQGKRLPPIIPVVLHHSKTGWTAPTELRDIIELDDALGLALAPFVPNFTFVLDDVSKLDDDAFRNRALTELARLTLVVMARCRGAEDPIAILRPWLQTILAVLSAPNGIGALSAVAGYILEVGQNHSEDLKAFFAQLGPRAQEAFVTAAEKLREEGRLQGEAAMLLRLLTRRFGPLPAAAREKVVAASAVELEKWSDRVLTATTLEEVLDG